MELMKRKDVPVELTWDLTALCADEKAAEAMMERAGAITGELEQDFKGKLDSADSIHACLDKYRELEELLEIVGSYFGLGASVDYTDAELQEKDAAMSRLHARIGSRLSFIDSEILALDEGILREAIGRGGPNRPYLEDLLLQKPHQLSPETERLLAALRPALNAPYQIYNVAKLADMRFPPFRAGGEEFPLSYGLYENSYQYDTRTDVRRTAFEAFSQKLREYQNVTAAAYQAQVQKEKILAVQQGYGSVFDKLLFWHKVDRSLYDRQIDLIMDRLAPHMRRYARLLQKVHGLDKMTYADLKLPLDPEFDPGVTVEQAREYIAGGLAVMGEDYQEMVRDAFRERWIDFAQNEGKETGGFCSSPYGSHSYILLSWHDKMSGVFTLAHELGHAGQAKLTNAAQSVFGTNISIYMVEAPSTMNELLLSHHLLKTNPDKRFRRWVLSCMVGKTYYHNFVTHLLEAAYQREVYKIVDAGGGVQAGTLNRLMRETLAKFWGGAVELNEGAELTWMRQPHYYMGLYPYTYSAGLTIATQVCKRIETEGRPAVDDWKKVLSAGGTKTPLELARMAGVDISTDGPLLDTIDIIGGYIDEICKLTEEL